MPNFATFPLTTNYQISRYSSWLTDEFCISSWDRLVKFTIPPSLPPFLTEKFCNFFSFYQLTKFTIFFIWPIDIFHDFFHMTDWHISWFFSYDQLTYFMIFFLWQIDVFLDYFFFSCNWWDTFLYIFPTTKKRKRAKRVHQKG